TKTMRPRRQPRTHLWLAIFALAATPQLSATRLPARTFTTAVGLPRDAVSCIVSDSKGFLWLCTADGVSRYDGYQFVNYEVAQWLAHRSVNAVLQTRSGVYLFATVLGLSRLDPRAPPGSSKRFVS